MAISYSDQIYKNNLNSQLYSNYGQNSYSGHYIPENSIFNTVQSSQATTSSYGNYDADDGKISFGQKVTSFVKGVFKPITNMFSSPGNFLKGALCIAGGAALIAVTGGAATPLLVAAGVVGGGLKIAKGAVNAAGAKTDAEAIAAWEDMGEGTGAVAASVAGSKAALKKAGVNTEGMSYLQATKKCFTGAKGFAKTSWSTASAKITGFFGSKTVAGATVSTQQAPNPEQKSLSEGTQNTSQSTGGTKTNNSSTNNTASTSRNTAANTKGTYVTDKGETITFDEKAIQEMFANSKNPRQTYLDLVRQYHPDSVGNYENASEVMTFLSDLKMAYV